MADFTVRADFEGGALSSDFGALLLHGADRQTGLIERLSSAIRDRRHASYIDHSLTDLLRQRIFQTACGYTDGNDANHLRHDPIFKLAAEGAPLDSDNALASGPTFSRLENSLTRRDIYRLAQAFVDAFIASYAEAPTMILLDMDHSEDRTHGQQEFAFYNHHYRSHCYLPLFLFEGLSGKFITAVLRPGKRPTGRENAAIIGRVLRRLRRVWPDTHILLRGDGHFSNPELMALCEDDERMDFLFGLAGNRALTPKAAPLLQRARALHTQRCADARRFDQTAPNATRLYDDVPYQAGSWSRAWRVVLKAEVMELGDNPCFVVTSLTEPSAELLYRDLYCARGQESRLPNAAASRWRPVRGWRRTHARPSTLAASMSSPSLATSTRLRSTGYATPSPWTICTELADQIKTPRTRRQKSPSPPPPSPFHCCCPAHLSPRCPTTARWPRAAAAHRTVAVHRPPRWFVRPPAPTSPAHRWRRNPAAADRHCAQGPNPRAG